MADAHTFDTKAEFAESVANPATGNYTCGSGATLLVLSIMTKTATTRTGTPTYNGADLTQAGTASDTGGEGTAEIWYLVDPDTGGSYEISVPNSGSDEVNIVASSYKAPATFTSALDSTEFANGTSADPADSITPSEANTVVVDACFMGYRDVASGNSHTLLYSRDTGSEGYASQYTLPSDTSAVNLSYTQAADDWQLRSACFKSITPPTGYSNKVNGVTSYSKINGIVIANISKVNGVS